MSMLWLVVGLVALQRLAELVHARRNTRRLLAAGGREVGAGHYPALVALHVLWLLALVVWVPPDRPPVWPLLGAFLLLQAARIWVLASLGGYWTTRVITLDSAPLSRKGPYRWMKHPNYALVALEIAILPLAFGAWEVALVFSLANGVLLRHRMRLENAALESRRGI